MVGPVLGSSSLLEVGVASGPISKIVDAIVAWLVKATASSGSEQITGMSL